MNLFLDNRTLTVLQVAVSTMLFVVMWVGLRTQKTYPGFNRWMLAKLPAALSWLLISLRGLIPDWSSVVVGHGLLILTGILTYEGIRQFRGKPFRDVYNPALFVLLVCVSIYFTWIQPDINARIALVSACGVIIMTRCVFELFYRAPRELRSSFWFTGAMFALYDLVLILRVSISCTQPALTDPFDADLWQSVLLVTTNVVGIGWTFGFFMMTNHRLALELQTAEIELREMASVDGLTGGLNRRAFVEISQREFARSRRNGRPIALLMMDIDYFKDFNDTYGHLNGDVMLCEVVDICRRQLREVDILARWGGEEIVVLLPDTGEADCLRVAERLRFVVAGLSVPTDKGDACTTISIGCALLKVEHENIDALLRQADSALYEAKRSGRNCVKIK